MEAQGIHHMIINKNENEDVTEYCIFVNVPGEFEVENSRSKLNEKVVRRAYQIMEEQSLRDFKLEFHNNNYKMIKDNIDEYTIIKIIITTKPDQIVKIAKYDATLGVQCSGNATGLFVHPTNCKFFINCWKGRAFVQPCAPGTFFNPATLECDFPYKVKCNSGALTPSIKSGYGPKAKTELLISESQIYESTISTLNDPKCQKQGTGSFAHPTDCQKFLKCYNGDTIIMDCSPGTLFNPSTTTCDWPRNVKGCEDEPQPKPSPSYYSSPKQTVISNVELKPIMKHSAQNCTNRADEENCISNIHLYRKWAQSRLEGYDVEMWLNTSLKSCAFHCKEADFTCRSFTHKSYDDVCLLSGSNIGMTGALKSDNEYDYYELKETSFNCNGKFICGNRKCINQTQVCDGKNDCNDRSDEKICTRENLDYDIRLAAANSSHEGRVEVKVFGRWGQVCDHGFSMVDAHVVCRELGFPFGAMQVRHGAFYGNLQPSGMFMVDQLKCNGNESFLRDCDFNGWGVHNCQPEEAVGVVCRTALDNCKDGYWRCDETPMCISTAFICDSVFDCADKSDESDKYCNAVFDMRLANGSNPKEGRVEVRHHGIWGTVCDDDFSAAAATVVCRFLKYGGPVTVKKDGFFGRGSGPIWMDGILCHGNESQLSQCEYNNWGRHNCDHSEDVGIICTEKDVHNFQSWNKSAQFVKLRMSDDILPANCGRRVADFENYDDRIMQRVTRGSKAPRGSYPWQASIRVRGLRRSNHWCGAVILSGKHILTAAHCLEGYNKDAYFVRAGDYNSEVYESTEEEANIEDYYVHEEFRKGHKMNNDIALILLKGHGIALGRDIAPICLPSENSYYQPGLNCTISGFGSIETGLAGQSKYLRYAWIPLLDDSKCREDYVYGKDQITSGMVCAGNLDEGVDTCDGDSGGPLVCFENGSFTLYGITSWGQHCGEVNKPGVYVRVVFYRQWIMNKVLESLTR